MAAPKVQQTVRAERPNPAYPKGIEVHDFHMPARIKRTSPRGLGWAARITATLEHAGWTVA